MIFLHSTACWSQMQYLLQSLTVLCLSQGVCDCCTTSVVPVQNIATAWAGAYQPQLKDACRQFISCMLIQNWLVQTCEHAWFQARQRDVLSVTLSSGFCGRAGAHVQTQTKHGGYTSSKSSLCTTSMSLMLDSYLRLRYESTSRSMLSCSTQGTLAANRTLGQSRMPHMHNAVRIVGDVQVIPVYVLVLPTV